MLRWLIVCLLCAVLVQTPGGDRASAETVPAAANTRAVVTGSRVNVRVGPGLRARRLTAVRRGTVLMVERTEGDWARIRHRPTGFSGWMSRRFLAAHSRPLGCETSGAVWN